MPEPEYDLSDLGAVDEEEYDLSDLGAEPVEDAPAPKLTRKTKVSMAPTGRLALQGMTMGWGDEVIAAAKSLLGDRTYDEELGRERAKLDYAREHSPHPVLEEVMGGVPLMMVPGGTGMRGMVASGAAIGGLTGAGSSDAPTVEGRLKSAATGALAGGALSGGIGAIGKTPAALRAALRATMKAQAAPLSAQTAKSAELLTDLSPAGKAARAAARRGEEGRDDLTREITRYLTEGEESLDVVSNYGRVGLKRGPVERSIAESGIDPSVVQDASTDAVMEAELLIQDLAGLKAERTPVGNTAVRQAKKAVEGFGRDTTGNAADRYIRLDELKRRIGKAVKTAGRGASRDPMAEEGLKQAYERLRVHLEDASVWGEGASQMQRSINEAWTPFLSGRGNFERQLLTRTGRRGVDPWTDIPEGDPAKVSSLMKQIDAPEQDLRLRSLREGSEAQERLMSTIADKYSAPEDVMSHVRRAQEGGSRLRELTRQAEHDAGMAGALRDVATESKERGIVGLPSPSTVARTLSRVEGMSTPRTQAAVRGARALGRGAMRLGRPLSASVAEDETMRHRVRSSTDLAKELASDPAALLEFGQDGLALRRAAAKGDMEFNSEHWRMMVSSEAYRKKMRELEKEAR